MRVLASVLASLTLCATAAAQAPPDLRTQLTQGQTALASDSPSPERLLITLSEAAAYPDMAHDAYPVARGLGEWALAQHRWDVARRAWEETADLASGAEDRAGARGEALTQKAAAIVYNSARGSRPYLSNDDAREALIALREAMHLTYGGPRSDPAAPVSLAEHRWAQARAWQSIISTELANEGRRTPALAPYTGETTAPQPASDTPQCALSLDHRVEPQYPRDALADLGVGDVVLLVTFRPDGQFAGMQVAGAVGGQAFVDSVQAVVGQWRASENVHFPAGCAAQVSTMMVIQFSVNN